MCSILRITSMVTLRPFIRNVSTGKEALCGHLHYLDGKRVAPTSKSTFKVYNPATGELLNEMPTSNQEDVNNAVLSSKKAFPKWSSLSGFERGQILKKAANLIRDNRDELSRVETMDSGKAIWEARFDVDGCADSIDYYAGLAAALVGEHLPLSEGSFAYSRREPLGVCGGIGAWNFPFQMAAFKSGPALACGNTIVFKPSQFTPLTAVMLAEIYTEAGLPQGAFNVIQGEGESGQMLSEHPDIAKMSFTGSVAAGSKVMTACAKDIKHVTLELGGKSPLIIFDDADIDNAVKGAICANFLTQGQVCSNGTRVYVHENIMDCFMEKLVAKTKCMNIGDPLLESTHVGATIHKDQAMKVMHYIETAKKEGASVVYGGERVHLGEEFSEGYFMRPCIVTNVKDTDTLAREEVFGAVMAVFPFKDEEEVVRRANDTEFGLAGGVFTNDLKRAYRVTSQMEAGSLYVNSYNVLPPGCAFGGFKKSGIGHENGAITLNHYTQLKTVYVEMNDVETPF